MRSSGISRRSSLALATAILALAAFLRFYHLEWAEYKLDEANLSRLALDLARHGQVPWWGIGSSVGIPNGALSAWLLAIPYAVSSNPVVATGFVAALNVLAVAMTWALARRLAGPNAAWVAALLLAAAPWAVLNSRKLWAQDLLPPFVIAYGWTAHLAFVEKKPTWLIGHVLALWACIQLHYSALALAILSAGCVLVFWWRRWPWKVLLISLALGLLLAAPLVYFDTPDFPHARLIVQSVLSRPAAVDASALQMAWLMLTGHDLHSLAGPHEFGAFLSSTWPVTPLFTVSGALMAAAIGWAAWQTVRHWPKVQARSAGLMALAATFPIALFVRHTTPVYPHYFIILYPWPFVLAGMLLAWLIRQRPAWRMAWWGGGLIAVIAAAQVYGSLSILHFVAGRNTPGGYGTPVGLTLRAVRAAEQLARDAGGSIVVYADGDDTRGDETAAVWDVLVDPAFAPRVVNRQQARLRPAAPAAYVFAPGPFAPEGAGRFTYVPLRLNENGYRLTTSPGGSAAGAGGLAPLGPDRWANGIQLLSARAVGDWRLGDVARWELVWRVHSLPPPGADYHWFNHLVNAEGRRVGQQDGVGFPASRWRVGDTLTTWFDLPLAPDARPGLYTMRVGMYTYPDIQNVPVLDAAGHPAADAVQVGPIEIMTKDE